jgi:hypothetical protein
MVGGPVRFIQARREGQVTWLVWGMLVTSLVIGILLISAAFD